MKKPFLFLLFVLAAVSCKEVEVPQAYGPVPTEAQMELARDGDCMLLYILV